MSFVAYLFSEREGCVLLWLTFDLNFCKVSLKVPVVVRLEGTNVDQGKRILKVLYA
jgi:hypothetical protein